MTKPGDLLATNWEEKYKKEHKLRQEAEAETETILVKGIGMNSPEMKAAKQQIEQLQNSMDRLRKENSECYNKIAELTDSLNSKDYFHDPDYKYLIDENRRLEQERNELLSEKKKMIQIVEDKIKQARKAGM
jgi:predicted RNase H-like nuclease (RuvC/YqgF family)